jgi:hypothetical protein
MGKYRGGPNSGEKDDPKGRRIADGLMADGIPTARGKSRWFPATIKAVTISDNAGALA